MTTRCIAYGDCNTEGLKDYHEPVWPELVARHLGQRLVNCGHTMSTTRELLRYAKAFPPGDYQVAFIQYGLVDSWQVFRGAPYVLDYPDNPRNSGDDCTCCSASVRWSRCRCRSTSPM